MTSAIAPRQIAEGIHVIVDAGTLAYASTSVYLIAGAQYAIVETGSANKVDAILTGLAQLDVAPAQIAYIVPTHIHMDHGGGAGLLAQHLPAAKVVVCKQAVRHVVDPSKLIAGTKAYHGEDYASRFGAISPVAAERVLGLCEGDVLDLGNGHLINVLHTPSHAPHHHSLYDVGSHTLFPGEAAGVHLAKHGVVVPCTGPGPFDLDATLADIARLTALDASIVAYSHWGAGQNAPDLLRAGACRTAEWRDAFLALLRSDDNARLTRDRQMAIGTDLMIDLTLAAVAERDPDPALAARLRAPLTVSVPLLVVRGYLESFRRQGLL